MMSKYHSRMPAAEILLYARQLVESENGTSAGLDFDLTFESHGRKTKAVIYQYPEKFPFGNFTSRKILYGPSRDSNEEATLALLHEILRLLARRSDTADRHRTRGMSTSSTSIDSDDASDWRVVPPELPEFSHASYLETTSADAPITAVPVLPVNTRFPDPPTYFEATTVVGEAFFPRMYGRKTRLHTEPVKTANEGNVSFCSTTKSGSGPYISRSAFPKLHPPHISPRKETVASKTRARPEATTTPATKADYSSLGKIPRLAHLSSKTHSFFAELPSPDFSPDDDIVAPKNSASTMGMTPAGPRPMPQKKIVQRESFHLSAFGIKPDEAAYAAPQR